MNLKYELGAFLFLVISLSLLGLWSYGVHQRTLREAAEAAYTQQSVELEGAKRALLATPKDVAALTTLPPAVKDAVKAGRIVPIIAGRVIAKSNAIQIPCPEVVRPTDDSVSKGIALKADNEGATSPQEPSTGPVSIPVTFGLTGEFFVGKIKGGAVESTNTLKATIWSDGPPSWHSDVDFDPANVKVDIQVSTEIAKAVEAYEKPWTARHLKFMCPGVFVGYNGAITGGVGCGFGVVW